MFTSNLDQILSNLVSTSYISKQNYVIKLNSIKLCTFKLNLERKYT